MATSYIEPVDLDYYLEGFVEDFYGPDASGTTACQTDMNRHFNFINDKLRGVETIATIPLATLSGGGYPDPIKEWQSKRQIYTSLISRHALDWGDDVPAWVEAFRQAYEDLEDQIVDGNLIFSDQISTTQFGLMAPVAATWTGVGTFYNSYNVESFPFSGDDFKRRYRIVIDKAGNNSIGNATFKWSRDNGVSYAQTNQLTGTSWVHLENNIHVRWEADSGAGNQVELNDEWWFDTIPDNMSAVAGESSVRVSQVVRG